MPSLLTLSTNPVELNLLSAFYRLGSRTKELSKFPKVRELVTGRARVGVQVDQTPKSFVHLHSRL